MATPSEDFQTAVYDALIADAGVSAIVGANVVDGRPSAYPAISFGPSDYIIDEVDCFDVREETLQIDCWVQDGKRLRPAKALADLVKVALHLQSFSLATHALALIRVESVRAFMDPDGLTGHGIVTVTATIEER